MKKVLSLVLAILLLTAMSAFAEMDFSTMTDDELHALIDGIRNELTTRELLAAENLVLFDQDGVTLYLTGEYEQSPNYIRLKVVMINNSDVPVGVGVDSFIANGWDVWGDGPSACEAGKKKKGELTFSSSDADISDFSELEDIEVSFHLYNGDTYKTFTNIDAVVVHFNAE